MNKKGFTLVELLAVFAILSLVIVIVASIGLRGVSTTKNKISEQDKIAFEEAGRTYLAEVINCDDDLKDYTELRELINDASINSCEELKDYFSEERIIEFKILRTKNYITGNNTKNIDGTVTLKIENNKPEVSVNVNQTTDSDNPKDDNKVSKLLKDVIIENAKSGKNGTTYSPTPLTSPANEISSPNEKELSIAEDNYGTSYYYRGAVTNNYLELNNICFRIVRIEGDGSIKITLAKEGLCSSITEKDIGSAYLKDSFSNNLKAVYGYDKVDLEYYFNYKGYTGENGLYKILNNWYNTKMASVQEKLKNETWCLGGKTRKYDSSTGALLDETSTSTSWYYETGKRLYGIGQEREASYKCSSEADKVIGYVGALIADEVVFAGGQAGTSNYTYYLRDNAEEDYYWLLSCANFFGSIDRAFRVDDVGYLFGTTVDFSSVVRPALTIATGVEIASGDGTKNNPYKLTD